MLCQINVHENRQSAQNSWAINRWLNLNTIHFAEPMNDAFSTLANLDWKKAEPAKRSALANTCTNTELL